MTSRVQRALGHLGFDQLGAGHVAHKDGGVVFHQRCAELVQHVLALVSNLRVDARVRAFLPARCAIPSLHSRPR
jgi:hypothetical protein